MMGAQTAPSANATQNIGRRPTTRKARRLNIRVTDAEKTLVQQAAELRHVSASQFILQSAIQSAEQVLADQTRFMLPPDKWDEFTALLDKPARQIPALRRASSKQSPFGGR
jgi:uncharacterized protein (DUF1778 family)